MVLKYQKRFQTGLVLAPADFWQQQMTEFVGSGPVGVHVCDRPIDVDIEFDSLTVTARDTSERHW